MSKTYREPHIQSLRALAALMVLIYHADLLPGGYIGVDIFYVISGYLITNLLLRELERSNGLKFSAFYARRFKRLLPASFLVILTTGLVAWLLLPATSRADLGRDLIAASTYISNFLFALWNADYQNLGATPSPFIHFWSLAVEEQFYIFWPFLLYLLYKVGGRRGVLRGITAVAVLSFLFSLYLTESSPIWSFYLLPTRAWEMAVGGLLLFVANNRRAPQFNRPQWGFLAIVLIGFSSFAYDDQTAFPGTAALAPVIATALLILSREKWPLFLDAISSKLITQWLGRISYPLYLWHWPVLIIPELYLARELSIIEKTLAFVIVIALADLTNRFIEEPLRSSNSPARTVYKYSTLATTFTVAIGILIINSYTSTVTSSTGFVFDVDQVRVKPIINQDGCHIHLGQTISPLCEYGDKSGSQTLVLYGDSHAAQWMPALDIVGRKYNLRILSLTKSGCPSAEVIKAPSSQYVEEECQAFRDSTIERIRKERPRAVILSGMQPFTAPNSNIDSRNWWLAGEAKAFAGLKDLTDFPIYLTDTPLPRMDIPTCLAKPEKIDCDTARPVSPEVALGFKAINPTPWLCDEKCNAVIDGIVVYRDHSHLSVAMSEYLAPYLAKELIRLGVIK